MTRYVLDRAGRLARGRASGGCWSSRPSRTARGRSPRCGGSARDRRASERARLQAALETRRRPSSRRWPARSARGPGDEIGAIFEAQALFARDPGIVDPALAAIADGRAADEAILASTDDQADVLAARRRRVFPGARGRRPRRRPAGRRDPARRPRPDLWHADGRPAIIVADDLDPSAVATLRPELVAGIALAGGAPTGHAAIVARGLGIPLVLGLGADAIDAARRTPRRRSTAAIGRLHRRARCGRPRGRRLGRRRPATAAPAVARQRRCRGIRSSANVGSVAGGRGGGPGRRRRHRPRPDRAAVPRPADRRPSVAEQRAIYRPDPRGDGGSAGRLPDARRRRRQARGLAAGPSPRRTRRSAFAASASASTGRSCSTTSFGRCSRRPPAASSGSCCRWSRRSTRSSPSARALDAGRCAIVARRASARDVHLGVMIEVPAAALWPTGSPRSPTSSASGPTTSSSTRSPPTGPTRPWPTSPRRSSRRSCG